MAICGVSLILALLDGNSIIREKSVKILVFKWLQNRSGIYLTGQVIAVL